jgi:hypothetical protein
MIVQMTGLRKVAPGIYMYAQSGRLQFVKIHCSTLKRVFPLVETLCRKRSVYNFSIDLNQYLGHKPNQKRQTSPKRSRSCSAQMDLE